MTDILPLRSPQREQLPLPKSFAVVAGVLGLALPPLGAQLYFTLRRRRKGTEIGLILGRLWWNLSNEVDTYPPSFIVARKWVAAYAARYGYSVVERKRTSAAQRGFAFLDG